MAATSETPSLPAGGPPFPTPYFPSSNRQRRVPPRSRKNPTPSRGSTPMGQEGGEIPLAAEQPPGSISSSSTSSATAGPKPRRKAPKQQKWKSKEAFDDRLQGEGSSTPSSSGSLESTPSAGADPKPKLNPNSKPFVPPGARSAPSSSSSKVRMPPRSKAKQAAAAGGTGAAQPKASKRQIEINPDLTPLSTQITQKLLDNAYECLICFENIGRSAVIWSCSNCYTVFHISCIKKWSASSINENKPWRCPGCQASFDQGQKPVGSCFCGKVPVPDFNPYQVPHSCGELCGRLRAGTDCPHPCNLICHPGPCPPCSAVGQPKPCFCGKKKFPLRCGEPYKGKSCGDPCGKTRACGLHFCDEICHAGSCSDCKVKFMQSCYCGRLREERFCGSGQLDDLDGHDGSFSCEQTCNRVLSCGNHKCQQLCHSGACKPCETDASIVTKCPCGKKDAASLLGKPRESCLDPIPLCSSVCGKMLTCGLHLCEAKCHHGECAPCQAKIDVACRCGSSKTKRVCSTVNLPPGQQREPITCDRVCNTLRNCGRHRCSNKCCSALRDVNDPEGAHICRLTCGKRMTCGVHKCELLCHKGRCPPCNMASYTSLRCRCGKTVRNPPIPCGDDQLPDCPHPCNREHTCDHPVLHNCHNNEECPPCVVLVSKPCMGRHEIRKNVPCYLKDVSCGRTCAKTLSCGVHTCQRLCHNGPCETNAAPDTSNSNNSSFRSCGQICGRERQACDHLCQALCHPGQPCPDVVCKEMMTIKCACGRTSGRVRCMRGGGNYDSEDRVWPCDDRCEIEKRNKRLAEALGVSNVAGGASVSTLFQKPPPYSSNLLAMASSPFIQKIEKVFSDLISSPTLNTHSFPPMNASQRQLIHELAFFYGLDTASYDVEPRRNVVVSKRAHSKVPGVLLSQMPSYLQQHQHVQQQLMAQQQHNPLLPPSSGVVPPNHLANASVESSLIEWAKGKPCLHIYELSLTTKTQHIASYFRDFSVQIRWLDDNNALVVFPDETTMKTALNLHPPGQVYKFKFYRDVADFDLTPFKATPLAPTLAQALASAPQPKKTADVWSKNESFFAALKKKESGSPSASSSSSLIWEQTGVSRPLLDVDNLKVETKSLKEKEPEVSPLLNCTADDWTALLDDEDEASSSPLATLS